MNTHCSKLIWSFFLLLVPLLSWGQVNLSDGLVAYFLLDGNAIDTIGGGILNPLNDGQVNGANPTTGRAGGQGKAMLFDGNDNIDLGERGDFRFGKNDFAISFWVEYDGNAQNADIVSKRNFNSPFNQYRIGLFSNPTSATDPNTTSPSNRISAFIRSDINTDNSVGDRFVQSDLLAPNTYHHVVVVNEFAGQLSLYNDAQKVDSAASNLVS